MFYHFNAWKQDGTSIQIAQTLHQKVRVEAGREPTPSAAVFRKYSIDSQRIKTTEQGGNAAPLVLEKYRDRNTIDWS